MTKIALVGNPNSGKTTVFNLLTGSNQHVGNWPGVTVERKVGTYRKDKTTQIQDLPGIYSLSPYTPEERVARDYLLEDQPDVILNIVDAGNLERNLYLTLQLIETGIPVVVGLNMMDVLKRDKKQLDVEKLSYSLGAPVIPMSAVNKVGVFDAVERAKRHFQNEPMDYDIRLETSLAEIENLLDTELPGRSRRFRLIKAFENDPEFVADLSVQSQRELTEIRKVTEKIFQEDAESIVVNERYALISQIVRLAMTQPDSLRDTLSDKTDRIVTHKYLALPIFAIVMWAIYYLSIQTVGTIGTDWVNDVLFGEWLPQQADKWMVHFQIVPWLQDLVQNGVIAGVGAVLGFLPQIFVLFFCLGVLEDVGYMSRVAFVMDRIFRRFGLSGKSFIPMLIATGCGVPGIMASRTIESEADRKITIMVTTFMPCSAKLPIIALISGAFFPHNSWIAPSAYFLGMAAIVISGIILKKTRMLTEKAAPFIMELPSYHFPQMGNVLRYATDRAWSFVKRAGTIIFVMNCAIWALSSYNFQLQAVATDQSMLATIGSWLAPVFSPLGWGNWRATTATFTGLVAKETIVGTFGVLYGQHLDQAISADLSALAAYSFMAFNLLCAPCFAAIGAIHREMNDTKWTLRALLYQTGVAYGVSFVIYQFGRVMTMGATWGLAPSLALVACGMMLYFLFRKGAQNYELA
jgi:ferrous iron transport protein B